MSSADCRGIGYKRPWSSDYRGSWLQRTLSRADYRGIDYKRPWGVQIVEAVDYKGPWGSDYRGSWLQRTSFKKIDLNIKFFV